MRTALVMPLVYKTRVIGALNILSRHANAFDETDQPLLGQFAAAVGVALEHARLFEAERRTSDTFETLAEIGRELASILDLDELLTRLGQLVKRVIDYRTFGVLLLDDEQRLCVKASVAFGEACEQRTFALDRRPRRLRRTALRGGAGRRRHQGSALPAVRRRRAIRAGHPADAQGAMHRRLRPDERRARRVLAAGHPGPDAARQHDGGGDRERPPLRGRRRQRASPREGSALRAAGPAGAAAAGAAEAAARRRRRGALRRGARARRRSPRLPHAGAERPRRGGRRRVGQGRAGGALQRFRRRAGPRPHLSPALHVGAVVARPACWRR